MRAKETVAIAVVAVLHIGATTQPTQPATSQPAAPTNVDASVTPDQSHVDVSWNGTVSDYELQSEYLDGHGKWIPLAVLNDYNARKSADGRFHQKFFNDKSHAEHYHVRSVSADKTQRSEWSDWALKH